MGRTTHRPEAELTAEERVRIANAREVLREFGLDTHPEMPEPLSELGYEQRMARGRALELAVEATNIQGIPDGLAVVDVAQEFYDFIWEAKV